MVIPVLVAGMLPEPWDDEATRGVLVSIAVFLVASTVGLAIARMSTIGLLGGFDWRRNRAWLALVALLAVGVVVAALPVASVVGPVVRVIIAIVAVPLFAVGILAGLGQISRRAVLSLAVVFIVGLLIVAFAGPSRPSEDGESDGATSGADDRESQVVTLAGGGLLVLAVIAGVLILARIWMRETRRESPGDVAEERVIDPGVPGERATFTRRGWAIGHRATGPPADASAAYVALLRDIDGREAVRRLAAESPAEHAGRLRAAGAGALGLDLLAADYELERFGERRLAPAETTRAIARWRRLRDVLGR
jgi:hypothetical protein